MRLAAGAVLFAQSPIQDFSDPARGRLSGEVRDEKGKPLAGARVTATPLDAMLLSVSHHTVTDANGRFLLSGLSSGRTSLTACKPDAFYPDATYNLWDGPRLEVTVPSNSEASGLVIQVQPAARLIVQGTNSWSGETVRITSVHIERVGEPNRYVSSTPQDSMLIPAAPLRIRVEAKGFEAAWSEITAAPRETRTITVPLRPLPEPNQVK